MESHIPRRGLPNGQLTGLLSMLACAAILIALALHLPPEFSMDLIEKAGLRLRSRPEDLIYGAVLRTMYKEPLDAIQEALHECGGPELKIREAL